MAAKPVPLVEAWNLACEFGFKDQSGLNSQLNVQLDVLL